MSPMELSKYVDGLVAKQQYLRSRQTELTTSKNDLREQVISLQDALVYLQNKARDTQDAVRFHIEDVVNDFINAVFPEEDYRFELRFQTRRNSTECDLVVWENGNQIDDPLNQLGGGVCNIISLALRIILLLVSGKQRVLVLDEPLKDLDVSKMPSAFDILHDICEKSNIQVIAVTHNPLLCDVADRVFKVAKRDGVSTIT